MRLVRSTCQEGVAGVVVTHDAQLASWADRVVFLRDGRVVDQTTPPPPPESLLVSEAPHDVRGDRASEVRMELCETLGEHGSDCSVSR